MMPNFSFSVALCAVVSLAVLVSACSDGTQVDHQQHATQPAVTAQSTASLPVSSPVIASASTHDVAATGITLAVYKSPTCGCCELWIEHLHANGIATSIHHPEDLNAVKNAQGILPAYQSCHTALSAEGYTFEGHIPAQVIVRFLAEKPEGAIGLAVPGMPLGSPGMELRDRMTPYDVLLLKKDGSSQVYEHIDQLVSSPAP